MVARSCVHSRMVSTMARIRTSIALGTALGTVGAALLMSPRTPGKTQNATAADDGMSVSARLVTHQILAGTHEQNLAVTLTAASPVVDLTVGRPPVSLAI